MSQLLDDLNVQQREAVTAELGPVLVLAGAGSGKTRVLTYRIAYLLKEKIFSARDILALTFTNKAANEMKERVSQLLGQDLTRLNLTMGTFHSVCARFLRRDIAKLGQGFNQNFAIYDTEDTLHVIKQIVIELGLQDNFRPQVFSYYISQAKNRLAHPRDLALDNSFLEESLEEVYERYQEQLNLHNALDFDDLLAKTCELLQDPDILQKYQNQFRYVLVDEYQDTNHAQYMMLKLLTSKHKNIFVVGDDAQSIYGFRGANLQNILNFKKDYPKAKLVTLSRNYRSTQQILDVAHNVIALNEFQYEKELWTENKNGQKVNIFQARDDFSEGEFVVKELLRGAETLSLDPGFEQDGEETVNDLHTPILNRFMKKFPQSFGSRSRILARDLPEDLSETVILYRTHAQSRIFEEALLSSGIPYQIVGGIKFYERKEIKDVLAYLRLVANPKDLVSLARSINWPPRGIGPSNFKKLISAFAKYKQSLRRLTNNLDKLDLSGRAAGGAREFFDLLIRCQDFSKQKNLVELIEFILIRSRIKESLLDGSEEGQSRWENVEQLINVASNYNDLPWQKGLQLFLEQVALMTDLDNYEGDENKLTLMTLHSAKGLEFDRVFFVGLEEGVLPHSRSLDSPEELAEEIRLAYVGITRAKRELFLSYALQRQTYGEIRQTVPSRIFKVIPNKMLREIIED